MKKKTWGTVFVALLCVCFALSAYLLKDKSLSQEKDPGKNAQNEISSGGAPSDENKTIPKYDYSIPEVPEDEGRITDVKVPVKEEDLVYVPWEFCHGLEVAVSNAELSKNLLYGVPTSVLPRDWFLSNEEVTYNKLYEINADGSWKTAHTYIYLWASIRNTTSEAIECKFGDWSMKTLDPETEKITFGGGSLLYNRSAIQPPEGLSDMELVWEDTVHSTIAPGETKDFFFVYYLWDEYLGKDDPALCINYAYGTIYHRYFRLSWE